MSEFTEKDSYINFIGFYESYGIDIISSYSDFNLSGKKINSNPLVYFYDSYNKVIFDYSKSLITADDSEYISLLLQGITNGNTFTITNSYYIKEQDGITSNINGVYQFDGYSSSNNVIFATKISVPNLNTNEFRYEKEYFVEPIQIVLNNGFTGDTANIIKSVINEDSIQNLGLYENDLIQIVYPGITQNVDRFLVEKVQKNSDGEEIIFLKDSVISENRVGKYTKLEIYSRGNPPGDLSIYESTDRRSAKIFNSKGVYLDCYEYQTKLQAYLRKYNYQDPNTIVQWGNTVCDGYIEPTEIIGLFYNTLVDVKMTNTNATPIYTVNKSFYINNIISPTLTLSSGLKYLFYQGHYTNKIDGGNQIVFTKVQGSTNTSDLLTDFYSINGYPGDKDSYTVLFVSDNIPTPFYYQSLSNPNINGKINVVSNAIINNNILSLTQSASGILNVSGDQEILL
jgi:hypothetical protein